MFYLNSNDTTVIPDSLFFLQKIGLLKYRVTEGLAVDDLYFMENNVPRKIYTLDTVSEMLGVHNTVLVFDFLLGAYKNLLRGQNIIVIPHVYFDYVTTTKDLAEFEALNSFKIYSPETNNTLVPKKHLKITLPFLKDSDFIVDTGKFVEKQKKAASNSSLKHSIRWATKTALSSVLVFCLKPFVQTKLFFAKYNFRYVFGQTRLFLIKSFYFFFNIRFQIGHLWFRIKQSRYVFYTYTPRFIWGQLRLATIRLSFLFVHAAKTLVVFFRHAPVQLLGSLRVWLIKAAFSVANLRFPIFHLFHRTYTFFRYSPMFYLGTLRVAWVRLFYFVINLRYPLWKNLSAFYWLNYKYTFYPIRKIGWFVEYQFQKRILKTTNVSKL